MVFDDTDILQVITALISPLYKHKEMGEKIERWSQLISYQ